MNDLDIQSSITRLKKIDNKKVQLLKFDKSGKEFTKLDNTKVCAEKLINGNIILYKIKSKRGGQFFNPLKEDAHYGLDKKDKVTNDSMFKLREVKEQAFNNYIQFLKTKQDSFLIIAEREI